MILGTLTDIRKQSTESLMDEWEKLYLTRPLDKKEAVDKDRRLREILSELIWRLRSGHASFKSTP